MHYLWQPIETAPKSTSEDEPDIWILACVQGRKLPMVTTWDHESHAWYTFNLALERQKSSLGDWKPTHWMPLPEPPNSGVNKPCPFCGGQVDPTGWLNSNGARGPECNDCGATTPNVSIWNQRAP